jgi:hypothetical protein
MASYSRAWILDSNEKVFFHFSAYIHARFLLACDHGDKEMKEEENVTFVGKIFWQKV